MAEPATVRPEDFLKRSPLHGTLAAAGARFVERGGAAVAHDFRDPAAEAAARGRMGLADLSPCARTGVKGAGTAEWLSGQGLVLPEASNQATRQGGGLLAARLAPTELLLLDAALGDGAAVRGLEAAWQAEPLPPATPRGFPVPRADSHAWLRVTGSQAPAMFAKLCGVDLRAHQFADLAIAQTQIARISAIVIRDDLAGGPAYHLLCDSASAAYLWACLIDAMAEFDGRPIGLAALEGAGER